MKKFSDYLEAINITQNKSELEKTVDPSTAPASFGVQDIVKYTPKELRKKSPDNFSQIVAKVRDISKRKDWDWWERSWKGTIEQYKKTIAADEMKLKNMELWKKYPGASEKVLGLLNKNGKDLTEVFKKNESKIETQLEKVFKSILGEFKITNTFFEITPSTKKHKLTIRIQAETNPSALGLKMPKASPKTTMSNEIENKFNEKKDESGPLNNFARFLSDSLDIDGGKLELKDVKEIHWINIPNGPFNNLSFNGTRIDMQIDLSFSLEL